MQGLKTAVLHGIPCRVWEEIPVPHGFFGRQGGASTLPHLASLNFGEALGDDPANIRENKRRVAHSLGFNPNRMVFAHQIHSNTVIPLTQTESLPDYPDADGFVTNQRGILLCVKTADCTPILLCDAKHGAVGALHAGWRGTVADIARKGVEAMVRLGAQPQDIYAAIGPCIRSCCYEIGEEVAEQIRAVCTEESCILSCRISQAGSTRLFADLAELNRQLLLKAGLEDGHIALSDCCTCCHSREFFSHRASGGKRGVMTACIGMQEEPQ